MILEKCRKNIDNIDKEIINLLAKRFEIVKKIGEYKKQNNIPPLQEDRWQEVLNSRKKIAKDLKINEKFIENIWNEIHKYALSLEK